MGIVGPSGVGKSTLISALLGEVKPSGGTVTWEGGPSPAWVDATRRRSRPRSAACRRTACRASTRRAP
ncbi:ATP-binding cassette domain-containing protein [Oerskovia sp. M15]